jgi:hypothetical protein
MVSIHLDVLPPDVRDLHHLDIWESSSPDGPWTLIDQITNIGSYPGYITEITTDQARFTDDWFAVDWMDTNGANTGLSNAIKGGTETVLGIIIRRVQRLNPMVDEVVVNQETEAILEQWFNKSPYDVTTDDFDDGKMYRQLNGLSYLVLARVMLIKRMVDSDNASTTIGLVSMKSGDTKNSSAAIQEFINIANRELGIATSLVLQMECVRHNRWVNVLEP